MRHSIYAAFVCGFSVLPGLPAVAQSTSNPAMSAPDQVAWQLFIQANTRAGGSNATRQVARSTPDGYTLVLGGTGTLGVNPTLYSNVGYDPRKDFAPVGLIGTSVNGTELTAESTTAVGSEGTPEVEVQVQNQGDSTENGISVSITVSGGGTLSGTISSIAAGETETVLIPLTPAPEQRFWFARHGGYFFLPSLRRMVSSEYLIPLPL